MNVDALRDGLQMRRVDAGRIGAQMVEHHIGGNKATPERISYAVRTAHLASDVELSVTVTSFGRAPQPTRFTVAAVNVSEEARFNVYADTHTDIISLCIAFPLKLYAVAARLFQVFIGGRLDVLYYLSFVVSIFNGYIF